MSHRNQIRKRERYHRKRPLDLHYIFRLAYRLKQKRGLVDKARWTGILDPNPDQVFVVETCGHVE